MKILINFFVVYCFSNVAWGQAFDSARISVGITGTYSSKGYQPHWVISNRFGTIADRKADIATNFSFENLHRLKIYSNDSSFQPFIKYGVNLFKNNHLQKTFLEEAYLKAGYKNWQLRIGRFEEVTGDIDVNLSSGSLGVSGNALPIPKVSAAVIKYTPVPFTKGWLEFKGQISHGWFGNNRYMKKAFLHEKLLYMRLGKYKFKLYGGVQHFGEWGGKRGELQLERSLQGFFDVLLVKEVDDGSTTGRPYPNRAGDQRGLLELGFSWETEKFILGGYHQTPFDSGLEVDFRNVDRLVGLKIIPLGRGFLKKIVGEFLTTKDMLSFLAPSVRQSYYNNGFYKTGWEYEDRVIGTPLFINRTRGSKYFSSVKPYNWDAPDSSIFGNSNIIVNRIISGHIGFLYTLFKRLQAKTLITYTQNYGRYGQTSTSPYKEQWYTLQEFSYTTPTQISIVAGIGVDKGALSDNVGIMIGLRKSFGAVSKL